jgi:hypothetical protein
LVARAYVVRMGNERSVQAAQINVREADCLAATQKEAVDVAWHTAGAKEASEILKILEESRGDYRQKQDQLSPQASTA